MGGNENAMYTRVFRAFLIRNRSICEKRASQRPRYAPGDIHEKGMDGQNHFHSGGSPTCVSRDFSRDMASKYMYLLPFPNCLGLRRWAC